MIKKKTKKPVTPAVVQIENGVLFVWVYSFNPVTGEYIGADKAFVDPLIPGEFLIPANATDVEPPAQQAGQFRKWNGSAWEYQIIPSPEPDPEPTTEELAAAARATRNARLFSSDWTQLGDVPAWVSVNLAAWQSYRQDLREVPQQPGFPQVIEWPAEPPRD